MSSDPFVFLRRKAFLIIWLSNILTLSVPDKDYSRGSSCSLYDAKLVWSFHSPPHGPLSYDCIYNNSNEEINIRKYTVCFKLNT